ncbi:hypothetical protein Goari_022305 [Gossypium aridum]|uniref:Uncharacterized protein n=1 Tax=Gossypium aridum TaxID=34290 RepID=A0A7J8YUT6_GOSAI|nr:hypothetical protein [Gossypium aridum]
MVSLDYMIHSGERLSF